MIIAAKGTRPNTYKVVWNGTQSFEPPMTGVDDFTGGSWKSRFASLRATTRNSNVPNYSCNDLGFRIVCECD
jgi:formylglycine-generating enzyme required for sulfatase activity